jgi:hypothetical protein
MYITDIEQSIDKKTVVLMIDYLHTSIPHHLGNNCIVFENFIGSIGDLTR